MTVRQLKDYLDKNHVRYSNIKHSPTYTAQETAQSVHIPGKNLAKTVIIKHNKKLAMVVISANDKVNFDKLTKSLSTRNIELANERDFRDKFPECEIGAMPPFGNLYDMDVYIDKKLTRDDEIAFNAGSHSELIQMSFDDFMRLVHPKELEAA